MEDAGLKEPKFQYDEFFEASFLRPSYYDKNYGTYDLSKKDNSIEKQLNATQLKMIELIKLNPRITQENMATEVGLSIHTIKKNVGILRNANILERKGSKKGGYWIIKQ